MSSSSKSPDMRKASFTDLIKYNLKFLNGQLKGTFYHDRPVNSETVPLLDKLKKINEFGFFTIEGQPSLCEGPTFISKTWKNAKGETEGNWWVKTQQIGYLVGFIQKTPKTRELFDYLSETDKVYFGISSEDGKYVSNLPEGIEYYNVTRESTSKSKSANWSKWKNSTKMPNEHHFDDYDIEVFKDCLFIEIALKKEYYEDFLKDSLKDSLEDILLKYYNNPSK
jgi:hypothetical protein